MRSPRKKFSKNLRAGPIREKVWARSTGWGPQLLDVWLCAAKKWAPGLPAFASPRLRIRQNWALVSGKRTGKPLHSPRIAIVFIQQFAYATRAFYPFWYRFGARHSHSWLPIRRTGTAPIECSARRIFSRSQRFSGPTARGRHQL